MAAYWLLLRRAAPRRSIWRGATFETIRRVFVKVAVRVEEMKSRIKLAFPASYPFRLMGDRDGITAERFSATPDFCSRGEPSCCDPSTRDAER